MTGVLASHPNSTDVHISSLSLTFHGQELLADTSLELNSGRRYGLIGLNGTGNLLVFPLYPAISMELLNFYTTCRKCASYSPLKREKLQVTQVSCVLLLGKSMLLSAIGHREVPIPEHIDIYHLTREMAPSDKTALQCVMEVDGERIMLEKEAERLAHEDGEWDQAIQRT